MIFADDAAPQDYFIMMRAPAHYCTHARDDDAQDFYAADAAMLWAIWCLLCRSSRRLFFFFRPLILRCFRCRHVDRCRLLTHMILPAILMFWCAMLITRCRYWYFELFCLMMIISMPPDADARLMMLTLDIYFWRLLITPDAADVWASADTFDVAFRKMIDDYADIFHAWWLSDDYTLIVADERGERLFVDVARFGGEAMRARRAKMAAQRAIKRQEQRWYMNARWCRRYYSMSDLPLTAMIAMIFWCPMFDDDATRLLPRCRAICRLY